MRWHVCMCMHVKAMAHVKSEASSLGGYAPGSASRRHRHHHHCARSGVRGLVDMRVRAPAARPIIADARDLHARVPMRACIADACHMHAHAPTHTPHPVCETLAARIYGRALLALRHMHAHAPYAAWAASYAPCSIVSMRLVQCAMCTTHVQAYVCIVRSTRMCGGIRNAHTSAHAYAYAHTYCNFISDCD